MDKGGTTVKGGISFCGVFFLVLFVMKIAKIGAVANWSWWWITAPLWGGTVLGIGIVILIFLFTFVFEAIKHIIDR